LGVSNTKNNTTTPLLEGDGLGILPARHEVQLLMNSALAAGRCYAGLSYLIPRKGWHSGEGHNQCATPALGAEGHALPVAIEAMKNAHREEMERELEKSQRSQISSINSDIEALRRQYL
jgi:hypothetical protein